MRRRVLWLIIGVPLTVTFAGRVNLSPKLYSPPFDSDRSIIRRKVTTLAARMPEGPP